MEAPFDFLSEGLLFSVAIGGIRTHEKWSLSLSAGIFHIRLSSGIYYHIRTSKAKISVLYILIMRCSVVGYVSKMFISI